MVELDGTGLGNRNHLDEWQQLRHFTGGDGGYVWVDPTNPPTVYHEFWGVSVHRSDNGGQTWADITGNLPHLKIVALEEHPTKENWLFVGTQGGGAFMAYDLLSDEVPGSAGGPAATRE